MEVHKKLIEQEWIPLKEPGNFLKSFIYSIPFMVIAAYLSAVVISFISPFTWSEKGFGEGSITIVIEVSALIYLLILVIIHECLHLIFIPNSQKTITGITFLGVFVATEEEISRTRYILISAAPYLILSIVSPLILGFLGLLTVQLKLLAILNALASSIDLLNLTLVAKQVPRDAIIKSNGWQTYWKKG